MKEGTWLIESKLHLRCSDILGFGVLNGHQTKDHNKYMACTLSSEEISERKMRVCVSNFL